MTIEWKSFLLRPQPEPRSRESFVKYTQSWRRPAEAEPAAMFEPWRSEHDPPTHSMPAAVAGKLAASFGPEAFDAFHHRLLEAYFTENRTVSDPDVLADVASEAGIDRSNFLDRAATSGRSFTDAVIEDHNLAVNSGITAVPAVVVDDRHLLTGALETAQYRRIVDRAAQDEGTA